MSMTAKKKPPIETMATGKKELISDILLWVIILDYIVAVILKITGWAIVKGPAIVFVIGFAVSIGIYIIIRRAIMNGFLETNQDGVIYFRENPFKYVVVCMMWVFCYVMGLLSPWIMDA